MTKINFLWTVFIKSIKLCCLYVFFGSNAFEDLNFCRIIYRIESGLIFFYYY